MMELLYHVDEKDNVIGPIERSRAHRMEILHRSGMVFLLDKQNNVLIQRRSPSKETFPGCYDASSTFHITFGETYDQGANRELFEETGIEDSIKFVGKFLHHDSPEYQIVAVYFCRSEKPIVLDPKETSEAKFMSRSQVDRIIQQEKITPWLREGWKVFGGYAVTNNLFGNPRIKSC